MPLVLHPRPARSPITGKIQAQGGKVLLTARRCRRAGRVINNSGMVEATSVRSVNGEIILDAERRHDQPGTLDASGKGAGETGGTVKVLGAAGGNRRWCEDRCLRDATAAPPDRRQFPWRGAAERAEHHSRPGQHQADAIASGNGGKVAVWSDGFHRFAGAISARGGERRQWRSGGNLGKTCIVIDGATVNTLAAYGANGYWLLDPAVYQYQQRCLVAARPPAKPIRRVRLLPPPFPTSIDAALTTTDIVLQANTDIP